jgi:tetratricopeptide (TPR) repeat protein
VFRGRDARRGGSPASGDEPQSVAICHHQLGYVLKEAGALSEAENAYREAAFLRESLGASHRAAETWTNLAICIEEQGRPAADVEPWYRKALAVFVAGKDRVNLSRVLNNLAWLLRGDPQRLNEARDFATEALAIDQTLDPGAAEIWKTYDVLADIATQAGDTKAARRHRALGRKAHAAAPIARELCAASSRLSALCLPCYASRRSGPS